MIPRDGIHILTRPIEVTPWVESKVKEWPKILKIIRSELPSSGVTEEVLLDLYKHTIHLCQAEFQPVPPEFNISIDEWLETTSYTMKEKESLRNEIEKEPVITNESLKCKCFCKAESYEEYKHLRPIKSRSDRWKVEVGPLFSAVNHVLFHHPCFVKLIPIADRPRYLKELVSFLGCSVDCTDFSTFEAHFIASFMYILEFVFYSYVFSKNNNHDTFVNKIRPVLSGNQTFKYKYFTTSHRATRASGEMCTSSGNGFANYCLYLYIARIKGAHYAKGGHEGDDGATCTKPNESRPTAKDYDDLGWICKSFSVPTFSEASFCGIVSDQEDLINVTNIKKAICEFGWTSEKYAHASNTTLMALLRAKGFSMVYQYPGCPILDALGHYALRITDTSVVRDRLDRLLQSKFLDLYKREILLQAIEKITNERPERKDTPQNTRMLVERIYQISVDKQRQIEMYLDQLDRVQPLCVDLDFPVSWAETWQCYVRPTYDRFWMVNNPNQNARSSLISISQQTGVNVDEWIKQLE